VAGAEGELRGKRAVSTDFRLFSGNYSDRQKIGRPNAENAEISQKKQPKIPFDDIFCDFCVTFAISAFGCPTLNVRAE
jgi:hypothetical protein